MCEYFHQEVEGRLPVKVVLGKAVPVAMDLTILGRRVEFLPAYLLRGAPHVKVTSISIDGQGARVLFTFDAEGVVGEARFVMKDGRYRLAASKVAER